MIAAVQNGCLIVTCALLKVIKLSLLVLPVGLDPELILEGSCSTQNIGDGLRVLSYSQLEDLNANFVLVRCAMFHRVLECVGVITVVETSSS